MEKVRSAPKIHNGKSFRKAKTNEKSKKKDFLKDICKLENERIFNYDGKNLPFENNKFDLLISQQVLEHVKYDEKENTIKEQSRVMKNNAYAYFQIPHILVPYEAHTKTWLIHWLPTLPFATS